MRLSQPSIITIIVFLCFCNIHSLTAQVLQLADNEEFGEHQFHQNTP